MTNLVPSEPEPTKFELEQAAGRRASLQGTPELDLEQTAGREAHSKQETRLELEQTAGRLAALKNYAAT